MLNKDAKVEAKCPNCQHGISFTVRQLQNGEVIICPNCHLNMDTTEAQKSLLKVEKDLQDFKRRHSKRRIR